jgi:serine/threonine protein phosphatase PrpC
MLVVGTKAYIANVGDSPIIVVSPAGELSTIHESHGTDNKEEMARIEGTGVNTEYFKGYIANSFPCCCICKKGDISKPRVQGLLITRAFGDFKARLEELGGVPAGIINDPFVTTLDVSTNSISAILLCTDGITDPLPPTKGKNSAMKGTLQDHKERQRRTKQETNRENIIQISTSNIAQYSVGQGVQGVGKNKVSGTVLSVTPDMPKKDTGPGMLMVETIAESSEDEVCRNLCEFATESRHWEGGGDADNATAVYISFYAPPS